MTERQRQYTECPRCERLYPKYLAALSRYDNETRICHYCGPQEALEMAGIVTPYIGEPYWNTGEDNGEEIRIGTDSEVNT